MTPEIFIPFEVENPFPLMNFTASLYPPAKEHSVRVDRHFGFRTDEIEKSLAQNAPEQQTWKHLSPQAFQTPYIEIRFILSQLHLQPGERIADLGCAYGRLGLVLGRHHPDCFFHGYEVVVERLEEARRILSSEIGNRFRLNSGDLTRLAPAEADYYFIYDYGTLPSMQKTLDDLRRISSQRRITVIARGRGIRALIHDQQAWLCEVAPPRHFETFSIYTSA